jgi:hypothetical protein
MSIETEMKEDPNGKTYARYTLVVPVEAEVEPQAAAIPQGFKVGDRVVFHSHMSGARIGEGTVTNIKEGLSYPIDVEVDGEGYWPCLASELTLIPAETPKKELKVGARVRSLHPLEDGLLGTVLSTDRDTTFSQHFPILVLQDCGAEGIYAIDELEVL